VEHCDCIVKVSDVLSIEDRHPYIPLPPPMRPTSSSSFTERRLESKHYEKSKNHIHSSKAILAEGL
jgi:hypothetical protein